MAAVMIGAGPHMGSHTAVAVGSSEEVLGQVRQSWQSLARGGGKKATALGTDDEWDDWQWTVNRAIDWVNCRRGTASGLLSLKGVEYPMATAILDILDPDV
jgi:hypothetical protein